MAIKHSGSNAESNLKTTCEEDKGQVRSSDSEGKGVLGAGRGGEEWDVTNVVCRQDTEPRLAARARVLFSVSAFRSLPSETTTPSFSYLQFPFFLFFLPPPPLDSLHIKMRDMKIAWEEEIFEKVSDVINSED